MTLQTDSGLPAEFASMERINKMYAALRQGTPEEREFVFDMFIVPEDKERRLFRRDQVLLIIWKNSGSGKDAPKARKLKELYDRYLSGILLRDREKGRPPESSDWYVDLWYQLARFNRGESLGERQMINIIKGKRGKKSKS